MTLVALGGMPLLPVGITQPSGTNTLLSSVSVTQDAANEACHMYGQVFTEDGASHTIDTTGSSSLGWRAGTVTFANAGSTFKVGLATLDNATGPPGRATNATDVITFSVSKSLTGGGGGITTAAWNEHVPDAGTMTIANGDFVAFCTQMTARAGADTVDTNVSGGISAPPLPSVTSFTGGAYAASGGLPNAVITFSDGTLGFFYGAPVWSTSATAQTWNSGSATKEYGNYFLFPAPVKIYGVYAACNDAANLDFVLYSDPLGTPVAEKTLSVDANPIAASNSRWSPYLFASPFSAAASQPLAGIAKPGASNVSMPYKTFNASAHQKSETLGANCYAINRASGAFAAQNANKDRFALGLLVGAFDSGGVPGHANLSGGLLT